MHHSDDPNRQSLAVTCYLDESGTDAGCPHAVIGGLLLNKSSFMSFSEQWADMLNRHGIESPLHMKEFGKGQRHGHLSYKYRAKLFQEVAQIINHHKIFSISATIDKKQYISIVHEDIRAKASAYGLCFILCVYRNHLEAKANSYKEKIAFLLDNGNERRDDIIKARDVVMEWQKSMSLNAGSITFDDDRDVFALQAADVIAWGARRLISNEPINKGREPINNIFDTDYHIKCSWDDVCFQELSKNIMEEVE